MSVQGKENGKVTCQMRKSFNRKTRRGGVGAWGSAGLKKSRMYGLSVPREISRN